GPEGFRIRYCHQLFATRLAQRSMLTWHNIFHSDYPPPGDSCLQLTMRCPRPARRARVHLVGECTRVNVKIPPAATQMLRIRRRQMMKRETRRAENCQRMVPHHGAGLARVANKHKAAIDKSQLAALRTADFSQ